MISGDLRIANQASGWKTSRIAGCFPFVSTLTSCSAKMDFYTAAFSRHVLPSLGIRTLPRASICELSIGAIRQFVYNPAMPNPERGLYEILITEALDER